MTQPRKKNIKKNEEIEINNDRLNSLREEFQLDQSGIDDPTPTYLNTNEDEANNLDRLDLTLNQTEDSMEEITDYDDKVEGSIAGKSEESPKNINLNTKMLDDELNDPEKTNFDLEINELRTMESQNSEENIRNSAEKSEKSGSNKPQRSSKQTNKKNDPVKNIDILVNDQKLKEENDFLLGDFEDHIKDRSNETFIKEITESLENDQYLKIQKELIDSVEEKILPEDTTNIDYVAEIESEIENAENATNPFKGDSVTEKDSDFISKLEELFPENYHHESITKPLLNFDEIQDNENSLSKESWQNVIKATEELSMPDQSSSYLLNQAPVTNDYDLPQIDNEWDSSFTKNESDEFRESSESSQLNYVNSATGKPDIQSSYEISETDENDESVDVLRRSFIEEFEQTPWVPDEEPIKEKGWLNTKFNSIKNWINSLNAAEKILLAMSTIISLAVIVAIGLVIFNWQSSKVVETTPPEIIDSTGIDLVYPTGLQLPGGWFFFLQEGKLINNKWDPQTAEWLPTSTIRRVVAIPWSRQAEAVVQTLQTGDEVRLFMNNNDILNYYVENVTQIDRENVEILTDTEPSLAVILFKSDDSDRWVVIAKP